MKASHFTVDVDIYNEAIQEIIDIIQAAVSIKHPNDITKQQLTAYVIVKVLGESLEESLEDFGVEVEKIIKP